MQFLNGKEVNLHYGWTLSRGDLIFEKQLKYGIHISRGMEEVLFVSQTWDSPITDIQVIQPVGPDELVYANYKTFHYRFMVVAGTGVIAGEPQFSLSGGSYIYLPAQASAGDSKTVFFPGTKDFPEFIEDLGKPPRVGQLFHLSPTSVPYDK